MSKPGLVIKKRLLIVLLTFFVLVISLVVRVAYIQIVDGERLQKEAFEQQNTGRIISPKRGTIYDRNGEELAISASVETITANPQDIKESGINPEILALSLSHLLDMDKETIFKRITKNSRYELIKKKVEKSIGDSVRKWIDENNIKGIYLDEDSKRYYPNRNLAAHVIGFTGDDNQGLNGIEIVMEKYLKGLPGKILSEVDAGGRELPFKIEKRVDARDGLNVVLTIDETIQYLAEKALEKAIDDWMVVRGGTILVVDPRNGDVLALVSKPDYDLNNPFAYPELPEFSAVDIGVSPEEWRGKESGEHVDILRETVWRNKSVEDTYEPGSTFKAVTSAAGLEEDVIHPDDEVNDFPVQLAGFELNCWKSPPHGRETFREGVYNSCNPVFVRVAQDLGIERFYNYVRSFGFYDATGISLPGEQVGLFHKEPKEIDMAVASFGQSFTITPIQLITAYTAIANGGQMIKPRLVKELTDSEGNIVEKFEPEVIRNVISRKTSETLMDILEGVVSEGTGRNAYVKGYKVAGKTGTSQTIPRTSGRYIASFSAIAPADNPVICVLVVLDDPKGESHMGGRIAAPVAGELVEDILSYLGVERRYSERDMKMLVEEVYVPDVRNKTINEAVTQLRERGLKYRIEGDSENSNTVVVQQTPKPEASIPQDSVVILYTYEPEQEVEVAMPNLLNKTIDEAEETLQKAGLNMRITGMGVAVKQAFAPGEMVPKGKVIEVEFRHIDNIE